MTLLGSRVLACIMKLRRGPSGLGWSLNPVADVHIRRSHEDRRTDMEDDDETIEERIEVLQLPIKDRQGLLAMKVGRGKERSSPRVSRSNQSC